ncbi:MAG: hypothetical protein A3J93_03925 [Candidatus Magasanikbacteria bacterium RIFOXYC2_FULL_42_28]|uniref:Multidrug ABC transporter substrate-binding protein n=1 Tax=Candidatus Magasanikbacteria bacterium RIFOXYC2_FULL_42_28 TaxID=1798704 RepID=A0A1F6NUZ5_9BACT|nr:MAG: hypothetical protein A3J93_03925 [Candidatus Magasanikbacteria bacterium RIFOXYC2_FULL_42_28]
MLFQDLMEETFFSVTANKSRSALTILGIVIGISSVIAMISVGQGASQDIASRISALGTNLLVVTPGNARQSGGNLVRSGSGSATSLTLEDAIAVKSVSGAKIVAPTISARKQVTAKGKNTNTSINGIDDQYFIVKNINLAQGIGITSGQVTARSKVAVLGPTTRDDLFGVDASVVGLKIRIGSQEYSVVGVTEAKGGTGFGSSDDLIYIPISTAAQYLTGSQSVSNINIEATTAEEMTMVQAEVMALLMARHRISDPLLADFSILNQEDLLSSASSVAGTMTMLLGAIAGISLLVGGIGIMNMMLTTVTERTREIGLRKSLGAKNHDISAQFLAEAVAFTFTGGIIGIILGWLASLAIHQFSGLTTVVNWASVSLSFGIAAVVGLVFGYYPAKRAAKLDPIEALRYQ